MQPEQRPKDTIEEGLLIERIAGAVARAKGLGADDTRAFVGMVRARMTAPAGARPAAFDSALQRQTYLTVVAARLLKDWTSPARDRGGATRPTPP